MFFRSFERAFAVALLLYYMGVATAILYPELSGNDFAEVQGTLHLPIVMTQMGLYLIGVFLIFTRWRRVLGAARYIWPIVLLTVWAAASSSWSIEPMLTLRRSVFMTAVVAMSVYLGERYTAEEFARITGSAFTFVIAAPLVLFGVASKYVLDPDHPGSWRGLAEQKNAFGMQMALACLLLFLVRYQRMKWLRYVMLVFAAVSLVLAHSMTSAASVALTFVVLPFFWFSRLVPRQRVIAYGACLALLATVVTAGILNSELVFKLLSRDATLTGRTDVWKAIIDAIGHRPWLGYGMSSFWTGLRGESLSLIIRSGWVVPEAHNGYLELELGLGPVGSLLFLVSVIQYVRHALEYTRHNQNAIAYWPLAFLTYFLLHNLAESDLMNNGAFLGWTIYVATSTALALHHKRLATATAAKHYAGAPVLSASYAS